MDVINNNALKEAPVVEEEIKEVQVEEISDINLTREELETRRKKYMNKKRAIRWTSNGICHIILIAIVYLILFPFVEKIAGIFQSQTDALDPTVQYIAKNPTLEPLLQTIGIMNYLPTLLLTFLFCAATALVQMLACTFIAYGFARFKFPGNGILFGLVIAVLLIPPQLIMSAEYLEFSFFNWLNIPTLISGAPVNIIKTVWPFVILSVTALGFRNSLYIYMMRQYFRGVPAEIEEAGMIDGSSTFGIFFRLMIPNAGPMMITIFLFAFSWQWTDVYYTGLFGDLSLLAQKLQGLTSYGAGNLSTTYRTAMVNTGIILVLLPLVIVYLFGQRFFVQGISRSGIVG